ncbi:hypothetical protein [uncultured Fusobacterium sp.]|uniref:hypothetical protein n=1 Tax=uncultured Fusobacterium sp. TaxID=159267 RepID=UPI0025F5FA57|nr:hypothetical protein [uncultured Fusobacterium sp.]
MLTLIGIILIAVGSFNIFQYNKAIEGSFYTIGTLISYNYSPSLNKYYPIFRYVVNGITYEEEYRGRYNNRAREELKNINIDEMPEKTRKFMKKIKDVNLVEFEVGKDYKLLVNKDNPKEYWIVEDGANKGREYILIIIGGVFLAVSFIGKIIGFIF